MPNYRSPDTRTDEDRLVVATPHVGLVLAELERRGVGTVVHEDAPELGLSLLGLAHGDVVRAAAAYRGRKTPERPLDRLLDLLYGQFEEEYGGWAPTIGKDRAVEPVVGVHHIDGGGRPDPPQAANGFRPSPRHGEPGRGVRVGIADTALYAHPWLAGSYQAAPSSMWRESHQAIPYAIGHATFIAGVVLQRAPGATLEVRQVLEPDGRSTSWQVARDLVRFASTGLDVLNLSFGCLTEDNRAPLVLTTALARLGPRVVVVAAAGNHAAGSERPRPLWPAALSQVVAVGATDREGTPQPWSPDASLPWIDVMAPGVDVTSAFPPGEMLLGEGASGPIVKVEDGFVTWSGTSFSAAHLTGEIAAAIVPGEVGPTCMV